MIPTTVSLASVISSTTDEKPISKSHSTKRTQSQSNKTPQQPLQHYGFEHSPMCYELKQWKDTMELLAWASTDKRKQLGPVIESPLESNGGSNVFLITFSWRHMSQARVTTQKHVEHQPCHLSRIEFDVILRISAIIFESFNASRS